CPLALLELCCTGNGTQTRGMRLKHCFLWLALSPTGLAQTLQIDTGLVTHNDTLKGTLKLTAPISGRGRLMLAWTDSYGPTVAVESQNVTVTGKSLPFEIRLKPLLPLLNFVSAELTAGKTTVKAGPRSSS